MFNRAELFNKPLNNWNTSSVERMTGMFSYATNFNQNLSMWCVSRITEYDDRHYFYNYSALVFNNRPKWGESCE
jgi:surface protein